MICIAEAITNSMFVLMMRSIVRGVRNVIALIGCCRSRGISTISTSAFGEQKRNSIPSSLHIDFKEGLSIEETPRTFGQVDGLKQACLSGVIALVLGSLILMVIRSIVFIATVKDYYYVS